MTIERLVGLFFFIGSILILVITFYPETNTFIADDDLTEDKNSSSNININSNNNLPDNFKNFSISDFDLFVYTERMYFLQKKIVKQSLTRLIMEDYLPFLRYLKRTINYLLFMLALLYQKVISLTTWILLRDYQNLKMGKY